MQSKNLGGVVQKIQRWGSVLAIGMSLFTFSPALATSNVVTADELLPGDKISGNLGLAQTDVRVTVARIIRVAMSILGIIVVVIMIYAGFLWMTAGGNDEQVGKAKGWIFSSIIGLVIILSAYALSTFVINQLVHATTVPESSTFTPLP